MKIIEKNGYKISELTLGTVQLGIPYGINNKSGMPNYEESAKILQTAIDGGVVSFDTAKSYGKSEEVLGSFFACNSADKTLITKVEFDKETPADIRESLYDKVRDSIKVLGVQKLPLVLMHSESYLDKYGIYLTDVLKELKQEGLVQSVGISFSEKTSRRLFLPDKTFPNPLLAISLKADSI